MPGLFDIQPIITVAWSLSYEFFYYLLIPLLVWALRMRHWSSSFRLSFFIMLLLLYTFFSFFRNTPHFQLVMFIAGILIYEITTFYSLSLNISPLVDYLALFVLMIAFILTFVLTDSSGLIAFDASNGYAYRVIVLFVSFFLFVIVCFRSRGLLRNIFSWTPLRWLGNMSYSYYLIHGLTLKGINLCIIWFLASNKDSIVVFWIALPICFSLTLVSSTALFLLVEKPFSFNVPSKMNLLQRLWHF
jgi:peptidoglycan/LPS O-acetylase OafA/YrhL